MLAGIIVGLVLILMQSGAWTSRGTITLFMGIAAAVVVMVLLTRTAEPTWQQPIDVAIPIAQTAEPSQVLDYRRRERSRTSGWVLVSHAIAGVLIGWGAEFVLASQGLHTAALALPVLAGVGLLFVRPVWAIGLGLILSLPLALLIFVGICFAAFSLN